MNKCPYCLLSIHFQESRKIVMMYPDQEELPGAGFDIVVGNCPACGKVIVLYRIGQYKSFDDDAWLDIIFHEEVIYPKHYARNIAAEVPDPFKTDFKEAAAVLSESPRASAAISRRSLQNLLREKFSIKPSNLAAEIEAFLDLPGIPSHIVDAVDAIRNIGNYAAHPIKEQHTGEIVEVEEGEAEWLLEVLEALFDFAFVQPQKLEERKKQLNEKLDRLGKPPMKGAKAD